MLLLLELPVFTLNINSKTDLGLGWDLILVIEGSCFPADAVNYCCRLSLL
jgi:hypothetical protein